LQRERNYRMCRMSCFTHTHSSLTMVSCLRAPAQISKALLGDDQRLRLPRFMEDEIKDPEQTKQELIDKINQLNASIDEVC
jgi:hypothetical protein